MEEEKKPKTNPVMLSIELRKYLESKNNQLITNNDKLFYYDKNHYKEIKDSQIHKLIFAFFEEKGIISYWRKSKSTEIIEALKVNSQIPDVAEMDMYDNLINVNNATINLDTLETKKPDPKDYFSYALDIDYNPELTEKDHPIFTEFLNDVFRNKEKKDPFTIDLMLYVIAYLIYPQNKMEVMFLFIGGGANGKSILIEIIKSFFPDKYVTSLSLNVMSNDESFNRNPLFYSKLNISTEAKVGKKVDSEEIKKISSGEHISLRNLHREGVSVRSKTKILLAGNDFVYMNDTTYGMDRRFCMFNFLNKFKAQSKYDQVKDPQKYNIYLAKNKDKLIKDIKSERNAIFNTLLKHLKKLSDMNWILPETINTVEMMDEYKRNSDILGTWLLDNYELDHSESTMSSVDILSGFREYYEENFPGTYSKHSIQAVGKKIKQLFNIDGERILMEVVTPAGLRPRRRVVYSVKHKIDTPQEQILNEEPIPEPQDLFSNANPVDDFSNK